MEKMEDTDIVGTEKRETRVCPNFPFFSGSRYQSLFSTLFYAWKAKVSVSIVLTLYIPKHSNFNTSVLLSALFMYVLTSIS